MSIRNYLAETKGNISRFLDSYISETAKDPILLKKDHSGVLSRLCDFSKRGKMIRGGLVCLGYQLFEEDRPEDLIRLGAAMELLQSALLVHDDIMDLDEKRRGETTVYKRYVDESRLADRRDPDHIGQALGICAGDLAFFLGFDLLNRLDCGPEQTRDLSRLFSREMLIVGMAQMDDVAWGAGKEEISPEKVIDLYRHKTGRYTFSLPLAAGALRAGVSKEVQEQLMRLGENLGILFQIRDDELGLLGQEEHLGKPVGSDILEGKKTLHYRKLREVCAPDELKYLKKIYGSSEASLEEIRWVQNRVLQYQIPERLEEEFQPVYRETNEQILSLPCRSEKQRTLLQELYLYNSKRNH